MDKVEQRNRNWLRSRCTLVAATNKCEQRNNGTGKVWQDEGEIEKSESEGIHKSDVETTTRWICYVKGC